MTHFIPSLAITLPLLLITAFSSSASAQYQFAENYNDHQYYVGLSYSEPSIKAAGASTEALLPEVMAGINLTARDLYWASLEARFGLVAGMSDWTTVTEVGYQTLLGLYLRGSLAVTEQITAYGIFGHNEIEVRTESAITGKSSNDADSDFS